jgi:hypothetical protein
MIGAYEQGTVTNCRKVQPHTPAQRARTCVREPEDLVAADETMMSALTPASRRLEQARLDEFPSDNLGVTWRRPRVKALFLREGGTLGLGG